MADLLAIFLTVIFVCVAIRVLFHLLLAEALQTARGLHAWVFLDEVVIINSKLVNLVAVVSENVCAVNSWEHSGDLSLEGRYPKDEKEGATHQDEDHNPGSDSTPHDLSRGPVAVFPNDIGWL